MSARLRRPFFSIFLSFFVLALSAPSALAAPAATAQHNFPPLAHVLIAGGALLVLIVITVSASYRRGA